MGDIGMVSMLLAPGFLIGFLCAGGKRRVGASAFALLAIGLPMVLWIWSDMSIGWLTGVKAWLVVTVLSGLPVGFVSRCRARDAGLGEAFGMIGLVPVANVSLALLPTHFATLSEGNR